jgi:hypothetical protein
VTFSRYPLTLLHHFGLGSAAVFWVANQFWFFALALVYLATYWLVRSARNSAQDSPSFAPAAAAAAGTR